MTFPPQIGLLISSKLSTFFQILLSAASGIGSLFVLNVTSHTCPLRLLPREFVINPHPSSSYRSQFSRYILSYFVVFFPHINNLQSIYSNKTHLLTFTIPAALLQTFSSQFDPPFWEDPELCTKGELPLVRWQEDIHCFIIYSFRNNSCKKLT